MKVYFFNLLLNHFLEEKLIANLEKKKVALLRKYIQNDLLRFKY
jgi:hypothetical protein